MAQNYADAVSENAEAITGAASDEAGKLRDQITKLKDQIAELASPDNVDGMVRENPYMIAGIALVAGLALGSIFRR